VEVLLALAGVALGLVLLNKGADWMVEGSSALATIARVSPLLIGLTIVAFGTSLPELSVSVTASLEGDAGISLGNVVGSNIANVLLVLGIAALLRPFDVSLEVVNRQAVLMAASAVLVLLVALDGEVSRLDALVLMVAFSLWLGHFIRDARRAAREAGGASDPEHRAPVATVKTVGGLVIVLVSAAVLVRSAIDLAGGLGVPTELLGLTVVAVGTSVPELVTSVKAARSGESDLSVGNVLGSNIFNGLCILGVAAAIHPLATGEDVTLDLVLMVAVSLVLVPMLWTGRVLSRREGAVMLAAYAAYVTYLYFRMVPGG
jgi:cation:H+ antiporter